MQRKKIGASFSCNLYRLFKTPAANFFMIARKKNFRHLALKKYAGLGVLRLLEYSRCVRLILIALGVGKHALLES